MVDKLDTSESGQSDAFLASDAETARRLRERALEEARERNALIPENVSRLSVEEARALLHELRVHHIELELQNEELRSSQELLERTRARYFDLYDLAPVGYVTIDEEGIVLEANLTAAGLLGATRSALLKQPWTQFVLPADQDVYYMHRRELFANGAPRGCELRLRNVAGKSFWVRLEARIAQGDGLERVSRTVLVDITERKRAEGTLQVSEARHRLLLQCSPDAFFTLAPPNWTFCACNEASIGMFGARDERELLSRSIRQCSPERQPDSSYSQVRTEALFGAALRDGSASFEWTFRRNAGEEFAATVVVARVESEGKFLLQATVRDQTEERKRRAASAQTERLASMGLLAASMGHEINNPLAYVLANVDDLAQLLPRLAAVSTRCSAGLRRAVGDAAYDEIVGDDLALLEAGALQEASVRARDALDGTLRIARISKALGTFARVDTSDSCRFDLQRAIESAVAMCSNELRLHATLTLDFEPIPLVWASEGKLSQVFLNLLINASHAVAESETRAIKVRTWSENGSVCVRIEDTGAGIEPENLARIFDPFFSTKRIGSSSGLGLSICRNIIDEFGGDIRVESELNKGSRFIVRLPVWTEAAELRSAQHPPASLPNLRGRVLIIDDEAPLRLVMEHLLIAHEVVSASSGDEALAILQHDRAFDLISCDLMMPEVTGMDVHHWLVAHDPALAARLVFITGGAFGPMATEYLNDAGNLKLEKPFTSGEFKDVVSERIRAAKSEPPTRLDIPVRRPGEQA
jgi:two-component system, cell cycle sensor histidine kinase and response regulator CckA